MTLQGGIPNGSTSLGDIMPQLERGRGTFAEIYFVTEKEQSLFGLFQHNWSLAGEFQTRFYRFNVGPLD
jgi:hypothetical protein